MSAALKVTYSEMEDTCTKAEATAGELVQMMTTMNQYIGFLCDNWEADASKVYRDDYASIASSVVKTSETVVELTTSVRKYMADLQALDQSYAGSKVTVN